MTHSRAGSQLKTDVPLGLLSVPPGAPIGAGNMMYFGETAIIITAARLRGKSFTFSAGQTAARHSKNLPLLLK